MVLNRVICLLREAFKDKWQKAEFFIDDVQELSWSLEEKYDATLKVSYDENSESITLSFIGVPEERRKQGVGSKLLGELCAYADKHSLPIKLQANGDLGTDLKVLMKFYEKHGFRDRKQFVKGQGHLMVRRPMTNLREGLAKRLLERKVTTTEYLSLVNKLVFEHFTQDDLAAQTCVSVSGPVWAAASFNGVSGVTMVNTFVRGEEHALLFDSRTKRYIDYTYRQFDKEAPCPLLLDDWRTRYDSPPKRFAPRTMQWLYNQQSSEFQKALVNALRAAQNG